MNPLSHSLFECYIVHYHNKYIIIPVSGQNTASITSQRDQGQDQNQQPGIYPSLPTTIQSTMSNPPAYNASSNPSAPAVPGGQQF